jgi:hypothetical protein
MNYPNAVRPNFFIVGAPRCGTTALYSYLRGHPDVFLPEYKEPHFFNTDMTSGGAIRNATEYARLFVSANGKRRVGEASVYYLSSKVAPHAIRSFSPDAKIIVMLRNPVDVIHALHAHHLAAWIEDVWDLAEALALEELRKQGHRLPGNLNDVAKVLYRETVHFSRQVRTYFDAFGPGNVHVIVYDDFKKDAGKAFRDTCNFLEVSPDVSMEFPVVWSNPGFRSRALARFVQCPPALLRNVGRLLVPRRIRTKVVGTLWNWNSIRAPRTPMSVELRKRLVVELTPQVQELSDLLGRDLSGWLDRPTTRIQPRPEAA